MFPNDPNIQRPKQAAKKAYVSRQSWVPKAVIFATHSEFALIPKDQANLKWYTSEEKKRFRRNLISDTRQMHEELNEDPTPELLCKCIGIESFMNKDLMMRVASKRKAHVQAILSEQWSQRQRGICDTQKLSNLSRKSSDWAVNKAHKLAVAYSELDY